MDRPEWGSPCVCGHSVEEHREHTKECEAEECRCLMYEVEDADEWP